MKKFFSIFLVVFFICSVSLIFQTTTVNAAKSGDFIYTTSGYTATITGYNSNTTGAVSIPNKLDNYLVTAISNNAFSNKSKITSVTMPDTITSIGNFAFSDCTDLESITLSNNLVSLGAQAFNGCLSLKKVIIPQNTTYLGRGAFYRCNSLEEISIPFVGAESGEYTKLSDLFIVYPNSLKKVIVTGGSSIATEAFADCKTLESVVLPSTLTSIGKTPFAKCEKLSSISVNKNNTKFHSKGNCIIETATKTLVQGCNNSVIPDDGSVKTIDSNAFKQLTGLKKIVIPNSVTRIEEYAFYQCNSLEEMTIPFVGNTLNGTSNTNFGYIFGYNITSHCLLPTSLKKITITGNCKLPMSCFDGCKSLKEVIIGESVYGIDAFAFLDCEGLEKVTIGSGVKEIQTGAFSDCSSLKEIIIPSTVKMIENYAFSECGKLASVTINNPSIDLRSKIFDESNSVKIYCTKGSNAEKYAKYNNIPYEYITVPTQNTNSSQNQTTKNNSNSGDATNNNNISNNIGNNQQSSNLTNGFQQSSTSNRNETTINNSKNNNTQNGASHDNSTSNDDSGNDTQNNASSGLTDSSNDVNIKNDNSSPNTWIIVVCVVVAVLIISGVIVFFIVNRKNTNYNQK